MQGTGSHAKLFLKRITNIKEKLEKTMEVAKVSRDNSDRHIFKGGKKMLREERSRKMSTDVTAA